MVELQIKTSNRFEDVLSKIKDNLLKIKVKKQIKKIIENPEVGKPMRNIRKGTRELYIKPFRLSYEYFPDRNLIYVLDLYHKKEQ
ncbi:type II toxin-antitoxin system RelE/ParE family toxin [Candidatus Pacearchaeota archaeon]|nr:type II toxin-antitoxin system RelE/ParE family toxin [Candidatus Pacearchaeota archaeon]